MRQERKQLLSLILHKGRCDECICNATGCPLYGDVCDRLCLLDRSTDGNFDVWNKGIVDYAIQEYIKKYGIENLKLDLIEKLL